MHAKSLQSCLTLCDPVDYSPPGSSVHGILQARILEWVAMSSSRGSSWLRDQTCVSCGFCIAGRFFTSEPQGKPWLHVRKYFGYVGLNNILISSVNSKIFNITCEIWIIFLINNADLECTALLIQSYRKKINNFSVTIKEHFLLQGREEN